MTLPASIRVNVRVPFPSLVTGGAFIGISKSNGVWNVAPDYRELAQASGVTGTQIVALQDEVTGVWTYVPALSLVSSVNSYRVITAPGSVTVLPTDATIIFEKTSSGASSILLPVSSSRGGAPVSAADLTGDANTNNITFVPASGETLQGFSASQAATNGIALIDTNGGSKTFYPLVSGGWYLR